MQNGHAHEISLEELASGAHERCAWCRKSFPLDENGKLARHTGLDGKYYCSPTHASATYIAHPAHAVMQ